MGDMQKSEKRRGYSQITYF